LKDLTESFSKSGGQGQAARKLLQAYPELKDPERLKNLSQQAQQLSPNPKPVPKWEDIKPKLGQALEPNVRPKDPQNLPGRQTDDTGNSAKTKSNDFGLPTPQTGSLVVPETPVSPATNLPKSGGLRIDPKLLKANADWVKWAQKNMGNNADVNDLLKQLNQTMERQEFQDTQWYKLLEKESLGVAQWLGQQKFQLPEMPFSG
jgi:hypothetical protein